VCGVFLPASCLFMHGSVTTSHRFVSPVVWPDLFQSPSLSLSFSLLGGLCIAASKLVDAEAT